MGKIKFRGKCLDNNKWVYGDLLTPITGWKIVNYGQKETEPGIYSVEYHCYNVDPDTVGQSLGVTDIKGNELFEGDKVELIFNKNIVEATIIWEDGMHQYAVKTDKEDYWGDPDCYYYPLDLECRVRKISDIYD